MNLGSYGGDTNSWKKGVLKRTLPVVTLASLSPSGDVTVAQSWRIRLRGLSSNLNIHVGCSVVDADGNPVPSTFYPNTAGTNDIQITPCVNPTDGPPLLLREVFQDPALVGTDNLNHPLPQALPYGWEGGTSADECYIDVRFDAEAFRPQIIDFVGQLLLTVTVEYVGSWWDPQTIQYLLGQVNITNGTVMAISTEAD